MATRVGPNTLASSGSSEGSTSSTRWSRPASSQIRLQACGDAHHVLGSAVEHVALTGHAPVEGQDAAPGDVVGEDPADRERQVLL